MKIFKKSITEIFKEETSSSDIFGKYLFGSDRGLPTRKNPEIDKPNEHDFKTDLNHHYRGSMEKLNSWIPIIDKLERDGKYTDFLTVPSKYKYAYRIMGDISLPTLTKILGYEPTSYKAGEIYEEKKNIRFTVDKRFHYSWTVDPEVFLDIIDDWGTVSNDNNNSFVIIVRAPIKSNRFLLNPEETEEYSQDYSYQKEIISVGDIKCDHIWYMPLHNLNAMKLADYDRTISRHVYNYENLKEQVGGMVPPSSNVEEAGIGARPIKLNANNVVYGVNMEQLLKELDKAGKNLFETYFWGEEDPSQIKMHAQDLVNMLKVRNLIKQFKVDAAVEIYRKLDTAARDEFPPLMWKLSNNEYEANKIYYKGKKVGR